MPVEHAGLGESDLNGRSDLEFLGVDDQVEGLDTGPDRGGRTREGPNSDGGLASDPEALFETFLPGFSVDVGTQTLQRGLDTVSPQKDGIRATHWLDGIGPLRGHG